MDLTGKSIKTTSNNILSSSGKVIALADVIDLKSNVLRAIANRTAYVYYGGVMLNDDLLIVKSGGVTYEQPNSSAGMMVNIINGEVVSIYPKSGNWENLYMINIGYLDFDLDVEASKLSNGESFRLFNCQLENPLLSYYGNPSEMIDLQNSIWHTGDLSDINNVSLKLNLLGQPLITGSLSSINKALSFVYLNCPEVTGDLSYFSDMMITTGFRIYQGNITGDISSIANSIVTYFKDLVNITGDISVLTKNISDKVPPVFDNCPLITGNINFMNGWNSNAWGEMVNTPLIEGDFSSLYNFKRLVRYIGTNVYQYTAVPDSLGFQPNQIFWYNSVTPIAEDDLVRLLADKRLYAETNNQINGTINIGNGNVAITNAQALADIAYLETQGWTITYNT